MPRMCVAVCDKDLQGDKAFGVGEIAFGEREGGLVKNGSPAIRLCSVYEGEARTGGGGGGGGGGGATTERTASWR